MNSYKTQSNSYKEYLEKYPDTPTEIKEDMLRKIKTLDFLSDSTKEERAELFNSGAFNDVARGYFLMAIDNTEVTEETKSKLLKELRYLFDTVTAEQATDYYSKH